MTTFQPPKGGTTENNQPTNDTMKNTIILLTIGAALYLTAAFTRPNEPAGRWLHNVVIPAAQERIPEPPRLPFSGLLNWQNEYQPRPTLKPLEVVPPHATPYTAADLAEIYPSH